MTGYITATDMFELEYQALTSWVVAHRPDQILDYVPHVLLRRLQARRGERAPQLLDPTAPGTARVGACADFVRWLDQPDGPWRPDEVASLLNGLGQTTQRGRPWTAQTVTWLRRRYPRGGAR